MDLSLFFGRFHPLVVHMPIGFLLMAALLELFSRITNHKALNAAVSFSLFLGTIMAIPAALFGWLLASGGGYDEAALFWHKWLGTGLSLLGVCCWLIKSGRVPMKEPIFYTVLSGMVLLIFITGHLGGTLTHGDNYLVQYAPDFIQKLLNKKPKSQQSLLLPPNPDSVIVYNHFIAPVLEAKCTGCHNDTKKKGDLALTSYEEVIEGGQEGKVIVEKNALESELFRRITLPQDHKKFMPPKGEPLSFSEIRLVEWWINSGAGKETGLISLEVPEDIETLIVRDFNYDIRPKPYFEVAEVSPVSEEVIAELGKTGFKVQTLSRNNNFLDIGVSFSQKSLNQQQIKSLLAVKEQITWLNLSQKEITDDMLVTIGQFSNLTRLRLDRNPITDQGIRELEDLQYLESLNLFNTGITNDGLTSIKKMPALRKLYLWQTGITPEGLESLKKERPELEVTRGVSFAHN